MDVHVLIQQAKRLIDTLIAPPFCINCRTFLSTDTVLCTMCLKLIQPVITINLKIDRNFSIPVVALGAYKDPLFSLIHAKNSGNPTASRQLGTLVWLFSAFKQYKCDVVVPIPLHWSRVWWRGFNQSEVMAQEISAQSQIPTVSLLTRSRKTIFQRLLPALERQKNVKNVFHLTPDAAQFRNKHIVIIDDVMTTGSTMREAARALRRLKPASITALVAARVID